MGVGHSGNLREVGDTDNLMAAPKGVHLLCHHLGSPSADACVNFIKNQRLNLILLCQYGLDGKHNTAQFSARSDLSQWL